MVVGLFHLTEPLMCASPDIEEVKDLVIAPIILVRVSCDLVIMQSHMADMIVLLQD